MIKRDNKKGKQLSTNPPEAGNPRREKKYNMISRVKLSKPGKDNPNKPGDKNIPVTNPTIRLNRYVSNSGVCSRREADSLIAKGMITVNGNIVTEMGYQVQPTDIVQYQGKRLNPETKIYILLNKPKDVVTTASDPEGRRTVLNLVEGACRERVYPVGRLDRNTTGVLLLTNDGDLSKKLTHPSSECKKIYHVFTNKPVATSHLEEIAKGITLEDGFIKVDQVNYADPVDLTQVGVELHSGRNRVVRRIFEHLGYTVEKLDRVYFAGLTKKQLPRGKWRFLTPREVSLLKAGFMK